MPEAPPWRPGHAGYSPQDLPAIQRRNRLAALFTTMPLRYDPTVIFSGRLPQLQRQIRNRGPWDTLAGIADYRRRNAAAGVPKAPLAYLEAMETPRFTQPGAGGGG